MALATKFRVQGTSDVFGQITVNIQLNDYAGPIIDLDAVGRDWIRLKIGDNSSEMSSPILAGKLTFSFYVTEDFETVEIGKSDVYTYYVEVLDENLDQIWAGWAMPEEYTEAYHNTPYVATVVASDGLQELKNVNYPLQDGKATLFTHLQNCLISTFVNNNIFESVNIYSNGMNSTASDSPFKQAQVTYNSFRSISETPKAYEVLSSLLVPFFARIYQYRGWRIEAILEKRSSYVVREYDITGAFVGQSTFNPLVKFDTDYGTFRAFIQKSGQLSIRPALNNAEVYFNTIEPVEPTTTGGFQDADDWVSTTELDKWTVVAGGGANQISIEQVPSSFDGNEFAVKIPGRKTSLELTDYIESDPVNIATADYESINVDFAYYANYPAIVLLGSNPILYFEIVFTETSSGDVYNWSGSEWVLIPLGQPRKRLRIDFNDRMKWRRYSAVIDRVPSTGNIKFRFYKLVKSGTEGVTELRLTAWKTNLVVSQPTNAALLLEAGTTNVFTQYKGPSFPHIISDGTVLNAAGVMDVANTLTATWARRGVAESLNIRRLFLTQWLSFNSRPTEILSGVIHQKGEVITPMSVVKDKDAVASTRYVMQSYEMSLGTGIGSASYREIVMEDANINAFQEFLDSIRLGDFFATTVNYNIFIGGAPGLSPGANPGQIDLNFNLNGDVRGGLNQAEITPAAIQNKSRLDLTGLTADDIVLGAVKDSPDQENMTNLRLSDIKPLVSVGAGAGLSIDGAGNIQLGNDGAGVVDISDTDVFTDGFTVKYNQESSEFVFNNSGYFFLEQDLEFTIETSTSEFESFRSSFGQQNDYFGLQTFNQTDEFTDYSTEISARSGGSNTELLIQRANNNLLQKLHFSDEFSGDNKIVLTDQINSKGLEYADDYSANWTDHSLVTKSWVTGQISGSAHNPVTIGTPANGLSISGTQVLSIGLASASATGALSSTDWNTFNNKLNLTSLLTGYTVGANTALAATDSILSAFGKVQEQINARISGTIASGQVAFGTGVNTVGGSANLTWDGTNLLINSGTFLGGLYLNGSSSAFRQVRFAVDDVVRWADNVNQNNYLISRYNTSGGFINNPISINSSSGFVGINDVTSPTNTLDVNGTTRIRTISNLGTAATSVLVPDATGVVSLRTATQFLSDAGGISGTIAAGQVAFGTGANTVGGDSGLTYDSVNDRFTIGGASLFGNNNIDFISSPTSQIYATSNTGVAEPFQLLGNLVIAPRTNAALSTYFVTNNGSNINWRWRIISSGILESRESNSIIIRTGNLNIRSDAGNGSIIISPNGTGGVTVGPSTTPTNTLDVNGTARIRTISNLGTAATSVLVPDATGVVSLRTATQFLSDAGGISGTIEAGQVAFGTGANTVGGSANLTWDGTNLLINSGTFLGGLYLNGSSSALRQVRFAVDDVVRWADNVNQNNYLISRYNTSGGFINNPISINSSSGFVGINDVTSPTNTLDVNGTARIRTISNLGTAATSVLVPSATGVVSLRTLAELASDGGLGSNWTLVSGRIWRNSEVSIGETPTSGQSLTIRALSTNPAFSIKNIAGTDLFSIVTETPQFIWNQQRIRFGGSGTPNTGFTYKGNSTGTSDIVRIQNSSENNVFLIGGNGDLTTFEGADMIFGTTTGFRFGNSTSQKLAFWNATPIVQPTTAVASGTLVSNAGTTLTSTDTIDGYTLQQVVRALRNTGLLA